MEDALARWRSEKTASYLSSTVAVSEPEPARAALFRQMADAAEEQAGILAKELPAVPPFTPSLRSRLTVWLIGVFGPRTMRPVLSASKVRGVSVYRGKLEPEGHPWPTSQGVGIECSNPFSSFNEIKWLRGFQGRAKKSGITPGFQERLPLGGRQLHTDIGYNDAGLLQRIDHRDDVLRLPSNWLRSGALLLLSVTRAEAEGCLLALLGQAPHLT